MECSFSMSPYFLFSREFHLCGGFGISMDASQEAMELDPFSTEVSRGNGVIVVGRKKVMGMTILSGNLFVVLEDPCNIVYKYGLKNMDQHSTIKIVGLRCPRGMASSSQQRCIYVTDWNGMLNGRLWCCKFTSTDCQTLECNPIAIGVRPYGVSALDFDDVVKVLVTCKSVTKPGTLILYELKDGMKVTRVDPYILESGSYNPRHCVMNRAGQVFVCFGWYPMQPHGVAKIERFEKDSSWLPCTKYGTIRQRTFYRPLSFTIFDEAYLVLVDHYASRILLFDQTLNFKGELVIKGDKPVDHPRHVTIDTKNNRLFIGQDNGTILYVPFWLERTIESMTDFTSLACSTWSTRGRTKILTQQSIQHWILANAII